LGQSRVGMETKRCDIYLINLDPTMGMEIQKTCPCVVISPDEMNKYIATVLVAPMTTKIHPYPSRVSCEFEGKTGQVVLDQIRAVDKIRLVKKLGRLNKDHQKAVLSVLNEMFAELLKVDRPSVDLDRLLSMTIVARLYLGDRLMECVPQPARPIFFQICG
jgi:mRNA interferase MazF